MLILITGVRYHAAMSYIYVITLAVKVPRLHNLMSVDYDDFSSLSVI